MLDPGAMLMLYRLQLWEQYLNANYIATTLNINVVTVVPSWGCFGDSTASSRYQLL